MVQLRRQQQQQQNQPQFSSEGFDLDALSLNDENQATTTTTTTPGAGDTKDVIYEIGGGATVVVNDNNKNEQVGATTTSTSADESPQKTVTDMADDYKAQGNAAFQQHNLLEAMDMYTAAIQMLPGLTASELLELQRQHEQEHDKILRQRLAERDERRRRKRMEGGDTNKDDKDKDEDDDKNDPPLPPFCAPPHEHGERLAVLHANRAAVLLHLQEYEKALEDVNVAILWKPTYTKAYLRRATLHEKMDRTEQALADAKKAQELDLTNVPIRNLVRRLQKLEDERLEKLKAETLVRVFVFLPTQVNPCIRFAFMDYLSWLGLVGCPCTLCVCVVCVVLVG